MVFQDRWLPHIDDLQHRVSPDSHITCNRTTQLERLDVLFLVVYGNVRFDCITVWCMDQHHLWDSCVGSAVKAWRIPKVAFSSGVPINRLYRQSFDSGWLSSTRLWMSIVEKKLEWQALKFSMLYVRKHKRIQVIMLKITRKIPCSLDELHAAFSKGTVSVIYRCNLLT